MIPVHGLSGPLNRLNATPPANPKTVKVTKSDSKVTFWDWLECDSKVTLVDVSDIFYFFCSGEGKGESGATGREGGSVLLY